ncbi:MAG: primosomal protein N' [Candidatus Latescibacter sp.]|nr:primosomal protein N' [Candidatus Latescibacter sp.]
MPAIYVSIALPVPLNRTFTYSVPPELAPFAETGRRALVPFGKRILTGFIVGTAEHPGGLSPEKIKPLLDIPDSEPVFDSHMLELASWVADYYISSLGEVLKTAMPFGTMVKSRVRVHIVDFDRLSRQSSLRQAQSKSTELAEVPLPKAQREMLEKLSESGPVLLRKLQREYGEQAGSVVRALEKKGLVRLEREMTVPAAGPKTERHLKPVPDNERVLPARAKKQAECLEALRKLPEGIPLVEFLERYGFTRGVVNCVVDAGYARYEEVEIPRTSKVLEQEHTRVDHPLNEAQKESIQLILEDTPGRAPRPVLLKGVTGSGKTRVYIELVREVMRRGKGAIILVPEIALTPQTTRFFTSVFPGRVAVIHSAMSPGERYDMWQRIHSGNCDVVIGPRSAVFAPLPSPGVIVVDEEHDQSYKQKESAPRYHARDVAVVRGALLGIPVVLGSATPSMESWHNASIGKYRLSALPERVDFRPLPQVITVDMREEQKAGNQSSLSFTLREELARCMERGEKSIFLINRRGFATGVQCRSCGNTLCCPDCTAALVYHASKKLAVCHLCGHERIVLQHCPECGADDLQYVGSGTQRVEAELQKIAGADGIIRMDSDTTRAHDAHFRLLEEFRTGKAPVLLGTQMVGKGLDIHEVTLVGVVSADSALYLPDFRAAERTFQLITQVAGRAGRGDVPGTVIVQTFTPDNYAVRAACLQNFDAFAQTELEARQEIGFPPFSRLILLELASDSYHSLRAAAEERASFLASRLGGETEVMGPVEAPIARIRGRYRMHILLKSSRIHSLRAVIREIMENQKGTETIAVDVDPLDMM